jgi:hypothetical protein
VDAVKLRIFFHIDKVIRKELGFKGLQWPVNSATIPPNRPNESVTAQMQIKAEGTLKDASLSLE